MLCWWPGHSSLHRSRRNFPCTFTGIYSTLSCVIQALNLLQLRQTTVSRALDRDGTRTAR
ncbi:hypothetical protein DL93DRAFT_763262 [Clavulina sp. PMI_390]|nr:hypothetical protein DL93DRAFT_763262 [Clavulina sp. PMI_390]